MSKITTFCQLFLSPNILIQSLLKIKYVDLNLFKNVSDIFRQCLKYKRNWANHFCGEEGRFVSEDSETKLC